MREIEIVRVEGRFTSEGGWRDMMINCKLRGDGHCCEVQICHHMMLTAPCTARKGLPGRIIYGRVRNAKELFERLDLFDAG